MKSEPIAIAEIIRALVLVGGMFGVAINVEEEAGLVVAATGVVGGVSIALSILARLKVFSAKTTQKIANRAARTGNTDIGEPPTGDIEPPVGEPPVDVEHGDYG